jgi:hypothetical protein
MVAATPSSNGSSPNSSTDPGPPALRQVQRQQRLAGLHRHRAQPHPRCRHPRRPTTPHRPGRDHPPTPDHVAGRITAMPAKSSSTCQTAGHGNTTGSGCSPPHTRHPSDNPQWTGLRGRRRPTPETRPNHSEHAGARPAASARPPKQPRSPRRISRQPIPHRWISGGSVKKTV